MATQTPEKLLGPQDLANMLGVPVQTIYRWRNQGTGPRGIRVGKHVRFRSADVDAWLDSRADGAPGAA